jgi:cysteine desulfurase/selenocysteine lyase
LQMDVQACHIDFLAADGHKWLLAPEGIAVFYCHARVRGELKLQQHGWRMMDDPYLFERDNWLPSDSAIRFEAGSPNMLGQVALHASVGLLLDVGMQNVEAFIAKNSMSLADGLSEIGGIELVRSFEPNKFSGIVSFKTPGRDLREIHQALKKRHLACAIRAGAIRLSPHFYQTGKPVTDILNAIELSIV